MDWKMARKKRVVINATLVTRNLAGIGRWSYELTRRLVQNRDFEWTVLCPYPELFGKVVTNPEVHYVRTPEKGRDRIIFDLLSAGKVLRQLKADVYLNMNYGVPVRRPRKPEYIATIHDLCPWIVPETFGFLNRGFKRWSIRRTVLAADKVVCVSRNTSEDIEKYIGRGKDREVIYNGIDAKFFKAARHNVLPGVKYLLSVGTLEPRKNLKLVANG